MRSELSGAGLEVAYAVADELVATDPGAATWLSDREKQRLGTLPRMTERLDFIAAHTLARRCAGQLIGQSAASIEIYQNCDRCVRPHGRPQVRDAEEIHVSMAHSRGVVAAAAGTVPVGVDVERLPLRTGTDGLSALINVAADSAERQWLADSADREANFARLWVMKESLIKVGRGRLDALNSIGLRDVLMGDADGVDGVSLAAHLVHLGRSTAILGVAGMQGSLRE